MWFFTPPLFEQPYRQIVKCLKVATRSAELRRFYLEARGKNCFGYRR